MHQLQKNPTQKHQETQNHNAESIAPVKEIWKFYVNSSTEVTVRGKGAVWKTKMLSVKIQNHNSETGILDDHFKCIPSPAPHDKCTKLL